MRCPECAHRQIKSLPDRRSQLGSVCEQCRYRFSFDPTTDKLTDGKFLAAVRRASAHDTTYFTGRGLYAAYRALMWRQARSGRFIGGMMALGCASFGIWALVAGNEVPAVVGIFALVLAAGAGYAVWGGLSGAFALKPDRFATLVEKWRDKERLGKLLRRPGLGERPPAYPEDDIYDYGFEKLLIVDDDLLVDLLVLNGFHAQERTLVVSAVGYPDYLLARAVEALEARGDLSGAGLPGSGLPVYFLHGASRRGVSQPDWLPEAARRRMVDLGLSPEDVKKLRLRHLNPAKWDHELAADMLAYRALSDLLSAALYEGAPLVAVLADRPGRNWANDLAFRREGYGNFG